MRLLRLHDDGNLTLTEDIHTDLPPYAILSHTWATKEEDVQFEDVKYGRGQEKDGWRKIKFCATQARLDGYQHCWIDTCCIDKSSSADLSEALASMFKWYANAGRCYVFLADVTQDFDWQEPFTNSRWFTRGWTLQELLAPPIVEFFNSQGQKFGNRESLAKLVSDITSIPIQALQPGSLDDFSIQERMQWHENRATTRPEDKVYSLLGLLDVSMAVIYGEGELKARRRLERELGIMPTAPEDFTLGIDLSQLPATTQLVGRDNELKEMRTILTSDGSRKSIVLSGIAGIGKTQLALAYALQHQNDYSAIIWCDAKNERSYRACLHNVARQITAEHPGTISETQTAQDWLCRRGNTRWLMICDGHDDPTTFDLQAHLPSLSQGAFIITSRFTALHLRHCTNLKLSTLDHNDSLQILVYSSGRADLAEDPQLRELAMRLDFLPLALVSAGTHLRHEAFTATDYIRDFDSALTVFQRRSTVSPSYNRSMIETWQSTYDQIAARSTSAASLLRLWAYLDSHDVWYQLLHRYKEHSSCLTTITINRSDFQDAVDVLDDHGLVSVQASTSTHHESRGYTIHSCFHAWLRATTTTAWDNALARIALHCVSSHTPDEQVQDWSITQQRLLNHAVRLVSLRHIFAKNSETLEAYHCIGVSLTQLGKLAIAEPVLSQVLHDRTTVFGENHEKTIDTVVKLGHNYFEARKTDLAQDHYERAYQWRKQHYGTDNKLTLQIMNNLASTYMRQNNLVAAEAMYVRTIEMQRAVLGENDASTLDTTNNLAILYSGLQWYDQSAELYNRCLKGYLKTFGEGHTSVHLARNNLGNLYDTQRRFDKSEEMYRLALVGKEISHGADHPTTLDTVNNLGRLLWRTDRLEEAEPYLLRAVDGYTANFGPGHQPLHNALKHAGMLYCKQKRLPEAEAMLKRLLTNTATTQRLEALLLLSDLYHELKKLQQALSMWLQWLDEIGDEVSDQTLAVLARVGTTYHELEYWDSAEVYLRRALDGCISLNGPAAEVTTDVMAALGITLQKMKKEDEALELYTQAYDGRTKSLPPYHEKTILVQNSIGLIYAMRQDWPQARTALEAVYQARMRVGSSNESTMASATTLGMVLRSLKDFHGAERLFEQALRTYKQLYGTESRQCSSVRDHLADIYYFQRKWKEAKRIYEEVLEIKEKTLEKDDASILMTLQWLALIHISDNELTKAEGYIQRVLEGWHGRADGLQRELHAMQTLGDVYKRQGKLEEARDMYHLCADRCESVFEQRYGGIAVSSGLRLAELYKEMERMEDATAVYEQTLRSCHRLFGDSHDYTLELTNDLGFHHVEHGSQEEAERLFLEALPRSEAQHGIENMLTLTLLVNLALLYARQGRIEPASLYYKRVLPHFAKTPPASQAEIREVEQILARAVKVENPQIYDYFLS